MTARKPYDEPRLKARAGEGVQVKKRGANKGGAPLEARARGIDTSSAANAALVSVDKPLTQMQRLFVKEWASGESILSASFRAGYSDGGTSGYRMARMPNILALYDAEKRAFEAVNNMSRKKVMDGLQDGINMATLLGEPASIIAGWREVGRMCGYYEPVRVKHEVTVNGKIMVQRMENMSDEELFNLIEKSAAQIDASQPLIEGAGDDSGEQTQADGG